MCKLLERIVKIRLQRYLENNDILPHKQYGFRKIVGTEYAHALLHTPVLSAFTRQQQLLAMFFYLRKAYDMVDTT